MKERGISNFIFALSHESVETRMLWPPRRPGGRYLACGSEAAEITKELWNGLEPNQSESNTSNRIASTEAQELRASPRRQREVGPTQSGTAQCQLAAIETRQHAGGLQI